MKNIVYSFVVILFSFLAANAQDSTSINNKKKIEELKARLDKLSASNQGNTCMDENALLKAENQQLKDSIKTLLDLLNAHPEMKKMSVQLKTLSSCDCIRVFYDLGKATTDYTKYAELDSAAAYVKKNPMYFIKIVGHSDKIGPEGTNNVLSMHRAEDVKRYLTQKFGIDSSRITVEGHGSSEHIREIKDPAMFYLDRRVEIYLMKI